MRRPRPTIEHLSVIYISQDLNRGGGRLHAPSVRIDRAASGVQLQRTVERGQRLVPAPGGAVVQAEAGRVLRAARLQRACGLQICA